MEDEEEEEKEVGVAEISASAARHVVRRRSSQKSWGFPKGRHVITTFTTSCFDSKPKRISHYRSKTFRHCFLPTLSDFRKVVSWVHPNDGVWALKSSSVTCSDLFPPITCQPHGFEAAASYLVIVHDLWSDDVYDNAYTCTQMPQSPVYSTYPSDICAC